MHFNIFSQRELSAPRGRGTPLYELYAQKGVAFEPFSSTIGHGLYIGCVGYEFGMFLEGSGLR